MDGPVISPAPFERSEAIRDIRVYPPDSALCDLRTCRGLPRNYLDSRCIPGQRDHIHSPPGHPRTSKLIHPSGSSRRHFVRVNFCPHGIPLAKHNKQPEYLIFRVTFKRIYRSACISPHFSVDHETRSMDWEKVSQLRIF